MHVHDERPSSRNRRRLALVLALTSATLVIEAVAGLLTHSLALLADAGHMLTGWTRADPLLSAAIAIFILPRTWTLLTEAVGVLLEGTPADVNLPAVREALQALPGVAAVHDLHVWTLTSGVNALSAHVVL